MAFNVVLQSNSSENNSVTKTLSTIATLEGSLREDCSIINPEIVVAADLSTVAAANYCTIDTFGRSYFITDMTSLANGLTLLSCHVDVLSSFATEIKANTGIVKRQEKAEVFNLYINDNSLVAYQNPYVLTEPFPAGFTGASFIMIIAGGRAESP